MNHSLERERAEALFFNFSWTILPLPSSPYKNNLSSVPSSFPPFPLSSLSPTLHLFFDACVAKEGAFVANTLVPTSHSFCHIRC